MLVKTDPSYRQEVMMVKKVRQEYSQNGMAMIKIKPLAGCVGDETQNRRSHRDVIMADSFASTHCADGA